MVKMGVTKGYPDGTFRGNKPINRYEAAVFLSKMAQTVGGSDVKTDIQSLKEEVAALKKGGGKGFPITGSFQGDWKIANLLATGGAPRGTVADYRLKLALKQKLNAGTEVKVGLDTMDYGYYNSNTANFTTDLLDVSSLWQMDLSNLGISHEVDMLLTYGPGDRAHVDATGMLSSETGIVYSRPYPAILASTDFLGTVLSGGYIVKNIANSGKVNVSQLTGQLDFSFQNVPLFNTLKLKASGDYYSLGMFSSTGRNIRGAVAIAAPIGSKIGVSGKLGLGGSALQSMMVEGQLDLNDVWNTGTVAMVRIARIGSHYLSADTTIAASQFDIAGLDAFDRYLNAGTLNLDGAIEQAVSQDLKLIGKGALRLSGDYHYSSPVGRLTAQGGISYAIAPNTTFDAVYRVNQDRLTQDTTDLTALGLLYNF
jgi:hypothetical protein